MCIFNDNNLNNRNIEDTKRKLKLLFQYFSDNANKKKTVLLCNIKLIFGRKFKLFYIEIVHLENLMIPIKTISDLLLICDT